MTPKTGRAVVVTGMHRSGTSAIAGVLHHAGFPVGDSLVPAVRGVNDKGFFEDSRILEMNERLFKLLNRHWYDFHPIDASLWQTQTVISLQKEAEALLRESFLPLNNWLIKDPRFSLLLPFWMPIFKQLEVEVLFVICVRPCDEVAMSISFRDDFDIHHGRLIWLQHYLSLELDTRNEQRIFVSYEKALKHDKLQLETMASFLAIDEISSGFIEPSLKHHDAARLSLAANVDSMSRDISQHLLSAMMREDETGIQATFDIERKRYLSAEQMYSQALLSQREKISDLEQAYQAAEKIVSTQKDQFEHQQYGFTQAVEMLKKHHVEMQQKDFELNRLSEVVGVESSSSEPLENDQASEHKYQSTIDVAAINNAHTKVIRQVLKLPKDLPVLEVGCSTGYLGSYLKTQGYQVWGIEPDAESAAIAKTRLDYVYEGSVEDFFNSATVQNKDELRFSAILFGDVLEHLVDPVAVMKQAEKLLSESGVVVASVPNVAHISVRMMLLEGRWEYQDTGIMDSTHLRFFTRDSLVDMISESGFKVLSLEAVSLPWQVSEPGFDTNLYDHVKDKIKDSESEVFQYIVSSTPMLEPETANDVFKSRVRRKVLCLLPAPDSSLASIRINEPLEKHCEKYGSDLRINSVMSPNPSDITWCDTVIFQREASNHVLGLMSNLKMLGKRIVFDIDDLLLDVPEYLTVHEHCQRMKPFLENVLRVSDAVSASTIPLQQALSAYNSNVHLVPNGAFSPYAPIEHFDVGDNCINLIVASSDTVRVDFIVDALKQLVKKYNDKINLIGIGPPGQYLRSVGLPIEVHPIMTHERFRAYLASQSNTIAWIPLDDSTFNRCKSAVKYFDYGLAGVPVLCSNMTPYADVVAHGRTGFLCQDDVTQWVNCSIELIESASRRQEISKAASRRCLENHSIERTAAAWQGCFDSLREVPPLTESSADFRVRQPVSLVKGILRRVVRPSAYSGALRVYRVHGVRGLWNFLTSIA